MTNQFDKGKITTYAETVAILEASCKPALEAKKAEKNSLNLNFSEGEKHMKEWLGKNDVVFTEQRRLIHQDIFIFLVTYDPFNKNFNMTPDITVRHNK